MTVLAASVTSSEVTPGVLGFLVVAGLAVALFFLLRSMNNQFKKLPPPDPDQRGGKRPRAGLAAYRAARQAQGGNQDGDRSPEDAGHPHHAG